jgi:hypothetical protein
MDHRIKKRLLILTATTAGVWMCGPAPALNGNIHVMSCACQATTDFVNAATTAGATWDAGTYTMVSTSTPMTAYVQVAGHLKITGENAVFVVTSATPVDQNGNSLAGAPEPVLETYYAAYDQVLAGTNRDAPINLTAFTLPDLPKSFGASTDQQVTDAVVKDALTDIIDTNTGDIIPIHFSDGTWAEFRVTWDSSNVFHLTWVVGKAWDSAGNPLNRDGSKQTNQNTSGTGSGSITVPGFGNDGSRWRWSFIGAPLCTDVETVTDGDGNLLGAVTVTGPC